MHLQVTIVLLNFYFPYDIDYALVEGGDGCCTRWGRNLLEFGCDQGFFFILKTTLKYSSPILIKRVLHLIIALLVNVVELCVDF